MMENAANSYLVYAADTACEADARALAAHLGCPMTCEVREVLDAAGDDRVTLLLRLDAEGLTLSDGDREMRGDLTRLLPRLKHNNLTGELLVKAAKLRGFEGTPTAVDATAGMGEDSLLLAAAGFRVILFEQDPVIAALLRDSLRRAAEVPELKEIVARMELREGDSIAALHAMSPAPDVVVLDPMFPERQKTGLVKKKFQLIHQLERPCDNETELVQAALAACPKRIVIKRPLKSDYLAGIKPAYSLTGKAIRYDCLVPPQKG